MPALPKICLPPGQRRFQVEKPELGFLSSQTKSFDLSAAGTFQAPQPFTTLSAHYL